MLTGVDHMSWGVFSARACTAVAAIAAVTSCAFAAERVTKEEAVAMVRKAIEAIKSEGADKAYVEIDDQSGPFVDRELYIVVCGPDGTILADGVNKARIGPTGSMPRTLTARPSSRNVLSSRRSMRAFGSPIST